MGRSWDAKTYHRVSAAMAEMAAQVLDRLELEGNEIVLDAGCGTGRVTARLLERLPRGRVIAVDADAAMVAEARELLPPERADVRQGDLLLLDLDRRVDAVFSTATFHWIPDHDRLFASLFRALHPGGALVAQCGGAGNIDDVMAAANEVASRPEWAGYFEDFDRKTLFAGPEETMARLDGAGFTEVRTWLQPFPVEPDDPLAYLETITCGSHVQRLPEPRRPAFVEAVADRLGTPLTVDYVRLNIDARRPR